MTSRDFCYWLQGFLEINGCGPSDGKDESLQPKQLECVRAHLALVFKHEIDPSMGGPEHQADLNKIHEAIGKVAAKVDAHVADPHHGGSGKGLVMRC